MFTPFFRVTNRTCEHYGDNAGLFRCHLPGDYIGIVRIIVEHGKRGVPIADKAALSPISSPRRVFKTLLI